MQDVRVICVGNLNYDLIFSVDRMPVEHEKLRAQSFAQQCGGSAANTAFWLARLGAQVAMLGCIGDDWVGRVCIEDLRAEGVDVAGVRVKTGVPTGIAAVFVNPTSKRMVTSGGANRTLSPEDIDFGTIDATIHVHVSIGDDRTAAEVLRRSRACGASTSCEFNGSTCKERVEYANICFMNFDELRRWLGTDDPLHQWSEAFGDLNSRLVVTDGSRGAKIVEGGGVLSVPSTPIQVVDRTGGGDAFNAGFLFGAARSWPSDRCALLGLTIAAEVIQRDGARPRDLNVNPILRSLGEHR